MQDFLSLWANPTCYSTHYGLRFALIEKDDDDDDDDDDDNNNNNNKV
jgi:hypothetical protein